MRGTIGLLGGVNLDEDLWYYRNLFLAIEKRSGEDSSPRVILHGGNEKELNRLLRDKDWGSLTEYYQRAARDLEASGATSLVFCSDVMHHIAHDIQKVVMIPILRIEEALKRFLDSSGIKRLGIICCNEPEDHMHYQDMKDSRLFFCSQEESQRLFSLFEDRSLPFQRSDEASVVIGQLFGRMREKGISHILLTDSEITYAIGDRIDDIKIYCSDTIHKDYVVDTLINDREAEVLHPLPKKHRSFIEV